MEASMTVLHNTCIKKGCLLNTLEKFHIYKENNKGNQINYCHTAAHNTIFDVILTFNVRRFKSQSSRSGRSFLGI
jgi:hypothetical protein